MKNFRLWLLLMLVLAITACANQKPKESAVETKPAPVVEAPKDAALDAEPVVAPVPVEAKIKAAEQAEQVAKANAKVGAGAKVEAEAKAVEQAGIIAIEAVPYPAPRVNDPPIGPDATITALPTAVPILPNEEIIKVHFGTNREATGNKDPNDYFSDHTSQDKLKLGIANVSIPLKHKEGIVEKPFSIFRIFTFHPDPKEHFVFDGPLLNLDQSQFVTEIKTSLTNLPGAQIVVYIHGLDNRFSEAAFRAAQITKDLRNEGIPVVSALFSWPTGAATFIPTEKQYIAAKDNAFSASIKLKEFLEVLRLAAPDSTIHLIAHSMGADVLSIALSSFGEDNLAVKRSGKTNPKFNEIILAAPDIRRSDFADKILPAVRSHHRVTLYASSNDKALNESKKANEGARAGDMSNNPVSVSGVQLIDATKVNASFVGHTFWADSVRVIHDIASVMRGEKPQERGLMWKRTYWAFP